MSSDDDEDQDAVPKGLISCATDLGRALEEINHCIWLMSYPAKDKAHPYWWAKQVKAAGRKIVRAAEELENCLLVSEGADRKRKGK